MAKAKKQEIKKPTFFKFDEVGSEITGKFEEFISGSYKGKDTLSIKLDTGMVGVNAVIKNVVAENVEKFKKGVKLVFVCIDYGKSENGKYPIIEVYLNGEQLPTSFGKPATEEYLHKFLNS